MSAPTAQSDGAAAAAGIGAPRPVTVPAMDGEAPEAPRTGNPDDIGRTTAPDRAGGRTMRQLARGVGLAAIRVALGIGVVGLAALAGGAQATDDALQAMGFDPDRAALIVALVLAALAATTVSLFNGGRPLASLTGLAVAAGWFGQTFRAETERALHLSGTTGQFDPGGWVLTLVTLLAAAIAVSWAAAILAREVRGALAGAVAALDPRVPTVAPPVRGLRRRTGPIARVVVVGIVAVVILPVLGDVLNYDPDVHMQSGGVSRVGLVDSGGVTGPAVEGAASAAPGGSSVATASVLPAAFPANLLMGPVQGSFVTAGALGTGAPWAAAPSGTGHTISVQLPGPWTGGRSPTATLDIYLPAGYDAGKTRYPVFYQAPWSLARWQQGMAITTTLDALIASGQLPPAIVVFASEFGGPYADGECANSFDGREWFDRYMAADVVGWVDAHLRTIATPQARVVFGFSQGGYCAAALLAQHPDVFRTSVSMSGYFQAGIQSATTPIAWRPFNNDPALMAAASPLDVVLKLAPAVRSQLMTIMEADPANPFYGRQASLYAAALAAAGMPMAIMPDARGHSWDAARTDVPAMLRLAALRMVKLGVFGPAG